MPMVYSTASAGNVYQEYTRITKDLNKPEKKVLIKGGANVADKKTLITPLGVGTKVSDEELDFLKKHPVFQRHMKKGFMTIVEREVDPEVVAADMTTRDGSAQKVPEDFDKNKAPTTGKGKIDKE